MCIQEHGHNSYHFQTKKIKNVWVQDMWLWKCHTQVAKKNLTFIKNYTYCNPIEQ
jgi:hypothetical protein